MKKPLSRFFVAIFLSIIPAALPSYASALEAINQEEDITSRGNAIRLHRDLRRGRVDLGSHLQAITDEYGEPYKMDVGMNVSEIRYRYSRGFNQGYIYIFLYFDEERRLHQWRDSQAPIER